MTIDQFLEDLKLLPHLQQLYMDTAAEIEQSQHYQFYKSILLKDSKNPAAIENAAMQIAVMCYLAGFYAPSWRSASSNSSNQKGQ